MIASLWNAASVAEVLLTLSLDSTSMDLVKTSSLEESVNPYPAHR